MEFQVETMSEAFERGTMSGSNEQIWGGGWRISLYLVRMGGATIDENR